MTEFPDGVADFLEGEADLPGEIESPGETDFPDDFGTIILSADSPLAPEDKGGSCEVLAVDFVRGFLIVAIAEIVNNLNTSRTIKIALPGCYCKNIMKRRILIRALQNDINNLTVNKRK